jgi:hypothetical protein
VENDALWASEKVQVPLLQPEESKLVKSLVGWSMPTLIAAAMGA